MARYNRPSYSVSDVFAASCAAHRVNGGYIKYAEYDEEGNVVKQPNKYVIREFLVGSAEVRDEDRDFGEKVRQYCSGLTFKVITGDRMSEFEQAMLSIADKETTDSNYDIAVASSLPASYERSLVRIEQDVRLREHRGTLNEDIGKKVELNVEVVRCNYSNNWDTHFVTAVVNDAVVFFASRNKLELGSKFRIKGKVKAHKEDRTQLSHVKLI
jgi:hypothetical protein